MTRYAIDDGAVVDTDAAKQSWKEAARWDGSDHISVATGSQWEHQTLYLSRKSRYYLEHTSQMQRTQPRAEWIDRREAAAWLILNEHELPDDLAAEGEEVSE